MSDSPSLEKHFAHLVDAVGQTCRATADQDDLHFTLRLTWENSQFVRFNRARVRQTGLVQDGKLSLTLMAHDRSSTCDFPMTGDWPTDLAQLHQGIAAILQELPQFPVDPFLVLPQGEAQSREIHAGHLLAPTEVVPTLLPVVQNLDFTGIYAAGEMIRAYADSAGQSHWFATASYDLDYSLFTPEGQALKGTLAGRNWNPQEYEQQIRRAIEQLALLARPPRSVPKGRYRTYFAPMAVAELLEMLNWGGLSEAALQQRSSCLELLAKGERHLSERFSLREDFRHGLVPRFNEWGDVAPLALPLIEQGCLVNTLINQRSAREYGKAANGANLSESLRAAELSPGQLHPSTILQALDTGLYITNLHYLNWSDRPAGQITGMTRYACFWVENGEIVAPIEHLRFDDSLYRFWGDHLQDLTQTLEFVPHVDTYSHRQLGGQWVPGILVDDFVYTL